MCYNTFLSVKVRSCEFRESVLQLTQNGGSEVDHVVSFHPRGRKGGREREGKGGGEENGNH